MPLIWCMNAQGAGLRDRVYGPTFMRHAVPACPAPFTHYFLGGSDECVKRLKEFFVRQNASVQIVGCHNGYFRAGEEARIVEEINGLSPDVIWVGLGTPKQQAWIERNRDAIKRGVILAVGFAFNVNAGMKPDAPAWMQRLGLGWMHRLATEPWRLGPCTFLTTACSCFTCCGTGFEAGLSRRRREIPRLNKSLGGTTLAAVSSRHILSNP